VAYAIGCRGEKTCRVLWERTPLSYKAAHYFSDVWDAYALVFPENQLLQSPDRGPTNHIERFNGTLRQRIGRLNRKSLSFSKIDHMHEAALQLFLHAYNQQ
jgi:insertion element IS1 protein InsB